MPRFNVDLSSLFGLATFASVARNPEPLEVDPVEADLGADDIDHRLKELAAAKAGLDYVIGRYLLAAKRKGKSMYEEHGFTSFVAYAAQRLGAKMRFVREHIRVAHALESLPRMSEAMVNGERSFSALQELTRVATRQTEDAWLDESAGKNQREIEVMVSGRVQGDRPEDPLDPDLVPKVIRLEVAPDVYATYREALVHIRREVDESLSEEELFAEMVRRSVGGLGEGEAPFQVALSECPSCRRVRQQAGGEMVEVDRSVLEQAECDGLHIGRVDGGLPSRAFSTVSPAVRRMVLARHGGRCGAPGCTNSAWVHIHHFDQGASRGDHDPDRLICLCSTHHRLHHKGKLLVRGKSWRDVEFFHVDGTPYGQRTHRKEAVDSHPVFYGLTGLGFSKSETRRLLSLAMTHVGREASEEELLREALRRSRSAAEAQAKDGAPASAQGRPQTPAEPSPSPSPSRPANGDEGGVGAALSEKSLAVTGLESLGIGTKDARAWVEEAVTHVGHGASVSALLSEALALRWKARQVARIETGATRANCATSETGAPSQSLAAERGQRPRLSTGGASMAREGAGPAYLPTASSRSSGPARSPVFDRALQRGGHAPALDQGPRTKDQGQRGPLPSPGHPRTSPRLAAAPRHALSDPPQAARGLPFRQDREISPSAPRLRRLRRRKNGHWGQDTGPGFQSHPSARLRKRTPRRRARSNGGRGAKATPPSSFLPSPAPACWAIFGRSCRERATTAQAFRGPPLNARSAAKPRGVKRGSEAFRSEFPR